MGLLKAGVGAAGGVLADSWRDYFYCDALDENTLMVKGQKRTSDKGRSSNTQGESNIISNGSIIAVNEGQCMLIVEQGAIVEVCAEPGEFVYDTSTEPSIFYGNLGETILATFKRLGERFGFGGDTGKDQRVYFIKTNEVYGNKYGTAAPIPFRVVDANIGLDMDTAVRMNGEYSYKITNPLLFYKEIPANEADRFTRDRIDSQMKSELLTKLQPALAKISAMGIRYSAVPAHTEELADFLNDEMSKEWRDGRGIEIKTFGINSITIPDEDAQAIKDRQANITPNLAGAGTAAAMQQGVRDAANNTGGAMNAFMGMGMAANAMAGTTAQLFQQGAGAGIPQNQYGVAAGGGFGAAAPAAGWTCECGAANEGNFCGNCGKPAPAPATEWVCECGAHNTGKFCGNCGKPAPAPAATWTCVCGQENEGNFCSNCGTAKPF